MFQIIRQNMNAQKACGPSQENAAHIPLRWYCLAQTVSGKQRIDLGEVYILIRNFEFIALLHTLAQLVDSWMIKDIL